MPTNMNMQELMAKAQQMQKKMEEAQKQLANIEVTGMSGGGGIEVQVVMTARYDARKVVISDGALKEDKEILEALIASAINDATRKIEKTAQAKIAAMGKDIGLPVGDEGGEGA